MGFEALLINKAVHTWGVPFYSGYGLTTDHNTYYLTNNKPKKTIEEIFKSMYFDYTLYVDLDNKTITNIEGIFARIKNFTVEKKIFSKIINFFC
jgi:capsular polysaccharide export protein